jgi:uncharacterized protein YyaL (SSP411 family)
MSKENKKPNALIHASSPYLLQHAYNPVEWNEWDPGILKKAKTENKLLIISIGYAACHWCHVMEHESFEKEEVADWMNNFYYNIKVDREERPDIDAVYMNAAQLTTGRGGWPLNVIALPDGRPVFAGTYFPKENWIRILEHFAGAWKKNEAELIEVAGKIEEGLQIMETEHLGKTSGEEIKKKDVDRIVENIYSQLDLEKGGLDKAPKFPMPCIFDFLLNFNYYEKDEKIKQAVHSTLVNMMEGGIYDQVAGGFARYSVDEYWFAPHFEKMLYDNGQLISLYSKAYALTGVEAYKKIADETIDWIHREMTDANTGSFYSSLDADSEGVEGKFYCFTKEEIEKYVTWHPQVICDYYSVKPEGNWEHSNILYIGSTISELCNKYGLERKMVESIIDTAKEQLYNARKNRIRPGLDDKCVTAWNAITVTGFLRAFQFNENYFALAKAGMAFDFLTKKLRQENGLYFRIYKNNKVSIPGFLDDQAFMIEMFIEMYRTHGNEKDLLQAKELLEKVMQYYFDKETSSFFYVASHQDQPVIKTREITDNVIPASNSVMASNLYFLGHYFAEEEWISLSKKMCSNVQPKAIKFGPYFSKWADVMLAHSVGRIEVAVVGEKIESLAALQKIPGLILMQKREEKTSIPLLSDKPLSESTQFYICKDKTCGLPINTMEEALSEIQKMLDPQK